MNDNKVNLCADKKLNGLVNELRPCGGAVIVKLERERRLRLLISLTHSQEIALYWLYQYHKKD